MKITIIAGARPNFMKIAPIIDAIEESSSNGGDISYRLVHTGQHYDKKMSHDFFEQLGIPEPHVNLEAGGGTQAEQTANIMVRFEKELQANPTDLVLVVGDVTSTMACSIVAKKLNTKVAHVEAGIRSGDMTMPEEINRIVTDAITDYFFTTSVAANRNLQKNGVPDSRIFFVGNTMIDTLLRQMPNFRKPNVWDEASLTSGQYFVLTLHRPANVDQEQQLKLLIDEIVTLSKGLPIVFPVHPRTAQILTRIGITASNMYLIDPLSYLEFNYLVQHAKAVITDSGGITEETTVMGIPCMTLRDNTERPETCEIGTNELLGTDPKALKPAMEKLFSGNWKKGTIPELWDGKTARRIVAALESTLN
ncbi:UDP-N-acetylglucosamine 2-epimerase (non-hydrolyzing) [Pontibacter sp. JH31]|uniref:UDP-N-acetylglucosamine 2-epimerase (Non-hydrolyzing) n=1 Tax=Pontibacter aquaedesilientis TaxID=2766980 RepID=A0ABR7XH44_9BACT|nr:UDP-N-acetylglucosamine 2-epimerase (non-hydrolyzing) [Pontibacter aquaedesilientis]MBD1397615.1 UDP-N-acetylglucosamine 2-epimerase (non-hydrolyzing) [Pontibacter aquaedesilientis]